jgi:hypothetical protein
MSGLCDLGEKQAQALEALGRPDPAQLGAGLKLLTGQEVTLSPEQMGYVETSGQVLTQDSLALCFFGRQAWAKGQAALGKFLEAAERSGVDEPELHILHAYLECSSNTPEKGKARLAALSQRGELPQDSREDLEYLQGSCGDKEAGAMKKVVSQVRLGKVVARVGWDHLKRSGLLEALERQEWVKAVREFVVRLGEGISKIPGAVQVSAGRGDD